MQSPFLPNGKSTQNLRENEMKNHSIRRYLACFLLAFLIKVTSGSKLHFDLKMQVSQCGTMC